MSSGLTFTEGPITQAAPLTFQPSVQSEIAGLNTQIATLKSLLADGASTAIPLGQPYRNTTGRQCYAHMQMSALTAGVVVNPPASNGRGQGSSMSVPGCVTAIREMRAMGYDGASLDIGDVTSYAYVQSVINMFAAANSENAVSLVNGVQAVNSRAVGKFSLFFTFDCSNAALENSGVTSSFFLRFCHDPAYLLVKDRAGQMRPRFSTYAGGGGSWAGVKYIWGGEMTRCRAAGVNPFFIPGFELTDTNGNGVPYTPATCAAYVQGLLVGLADGYWNFGSQESPLAASGAVNNLSPILQQQVMAQAVKAAGLWNEGTFKAQVIHSDWRYYSECYGAEAVNAYTQLLLTPGLFDSAQGIGYNDYNEGTAQSNLDPGPGGAWNYAFYSAAINNSEGYWKTKLGLQDLLNTLFQPFKTGQSPTYSRDDLYAAYICQTGDMIATNDPLGQYLYFNTDAAGNPSPRTTPEDLFFVRLDLKAAAVLTVTQNGVVKTRFAPPGTSFFRIPKVAGDAHFAVVRDGITTVAVTGTAVLGSSNPSVLNSLNYAWHSGHSN